MADIAGNKITRFLASVRNKRRNRLEKKDAFQKMLYVLLTLLSVFMLIPLVFIFTNSLKPYQELFIVPPRIYVEDPSLHNFKELFLLSSNSAVPVTRYLFNSAAVTLLTVAGVVIVSALCAYPLSKHKFPGHKVLFAAILLTLMFAPETVGIPRYLVVSKLGIMNTYFGHLLPALAAPVSVFLMKQFVDQVPNELLEAAKMDGAREFTVFLKIVIPTIMPAVATVAILTFQSAWGNVETSRLFMQDESMKTFPFFLGTITSGAANSVARQGAAAAAALILFLPNFLFFLFYQRKVIATMAHSGIK
ncbi:carbohydrate ABC transporter permease [Paenibacillus contaminans]|jgi:ABC-type glycerol-3-phosphate transport system permease component|uniref:Carbohydrate ABC transporter permease n=1 Tax=Paenibacillus contaminans TaxID=450362 RepID=A0A329MNT2_9BACL|nr:carbohydrate ABC transporter permease [Paenibacillus contaminans]RAV21434.1 carbohydrate ABC transporter permease [Paenibacillus contaminans]